MTFPKIKLTSLLALVPRLEGITAAAVVFVIDCFFLPFFCGVCPSPLPSLLARARSSENCIVVNKISHSGAVISTGAY